MNFSNANKVLDVINATETIERERALNRDKISKGINGFPPMSESEAKQMGLKVNINWLEETVLAKQACLQYTNAFQSRNNFFTVQVPSAPPEIKMDIELQITRFINKPLKASREFAALLDERFSSVVAHGIAPQIWTSSEDWLAEYVALSDFRVPTDTATSLKNMTWNAVLRRYTVGELVKRVFGRDSNKGWNKKAIINILAAYWDKNWENSPDDWSNNPEKMTKLVTQNTGFYQSDAVPVIPLWHFYHLDDENPLNQQWMMKVVPDKACLATGASGQSTDMTKFLFESDKPIAEKLDHLIHIQFGDLNGTPPYLFHSVRSLGFLLHESSYWMNLFRCRTFQHAWESFNLLWRSSDGSPKARAQFLELFHKGYVPDNVTIIPQDQKNTVDQDLIEFVMAQSKQLMGEASTSYTQDVDTGNKKEQTFGEAQIKMQQANAMMSGLLTVAARNEVFAYREIARRFCNKKSLNPDVRKFWQQCKQAKIPTQFIDVDLWEISCDMPLGAGNQTLELAQASQLMQVRAAHSPDAQQEILHQYDAAVTRNPALAQKLAPLGVKPPLSSGTQWATAIFGTLMQGAPAVPMQSEINPIDQIKTLLGLMAGVVQKIMQTGNMGTPGDVAGLQNVLAYLMGNPQTKQPGLIQILAQDPSQKQAVKQFSDAIGKLSNLVKGFAQRQSEAGKQKQAPKLLESIAYKDCPEDVKRQMEAAAGLQPSRMQTPNPEMAKAQQGMAIKDAQFKQKSKQDQIKFAVEQLKSVTEHRQNLSHEEEAHRQDLMHTTASKLLELIGGQQQTTEPATEEPPQTAGK